MSEPVKPQCIEALEEHMKQLSAELGGQRVVLKAEITRAGGFRWTFEYEQLEHLTVDGDPPSKDT